MEVTAIIAVGGDADEYVANCLSYLVRQNVSFSIIDNGMGEAGRAVLLRPGIRANLVERIDVPFAGRFELKAQLALKEEIIGRSSADWIIHHDIDEIMHSYRGGESLHDAIARIGNGDANVIELDEYAFMPIERDYVADLDDWQPILHYYAFRLVLQRIWKREAGLSLFRRDGSGAGGHLLFGDKIRVAPETLALRHYFVRSQMHAYRKYTRRAYSEIEVDHGWHSDKIGVDAASFAFPDVSQLRRLDSPGSVGLDRVRPRLRHYWLWAAARRSAGGAANA